MSSFDPDTFLNTTYEGELDTRRVPLPVDDYVATILEVNPGTTPRGTAYMEILWEVDHAELASELGRPKSRVRQTVWLDLTESGDLDFGRGKNIMLGRLREAVGQNAPGQPWSPAQLVGQAARVRVKHRPDKNDPEVVYEEVSGVSAL